MIGYIFIFITAAAVAAVPVALTILVISFMKHLRKQKLEKGDIDLMEEVKAFVKPKEQE